MSAIDQKKYLKKYLGIGKSKGDKKKKKKSKKVGPQRFTIVDDDIEVSLNEQIKEDLKADDEDAPQIVSVIDDRPPSLRIDEVSKNKLWLPIGAPSENSAATIGLKFEGNLKLNKPDSNSSKRHTADQLNDRHIKKESRNKPSTQTSPDRSPPRKIKREPVSPPRASVDYTSEASPPIRIKREKSEDKSPPRRKSGKSPSSDNDNSPPRRKRSYHNSPDSGRRKSPPKQSVDADISPPRKLKREKNEDISPPRRPSRKSPSRERDISPPRRKHKYHDSPERHKTVTPKVRGDGDMSPRRSRKNNSPLQSTSASAGDISPPRRAKHTSEDSPPRKTSKLSNSQHHHKRDKPRKQSRWAENDEDTANKLKKTLDGKTAGLQNATDLVTETTELKRKEDELFKNMSAEISGANAATVVRSKKKEIDWEAEEQKRKKEAENKEKYDKWGKGLKQVGDARERMEDELHEMSKPLARYADDEDLEKYLKEQEREGDPMLAYIRKKKKKKAIDEGKPITQEYQGDAPANRFGIRPGYRWDGVNRSNGYEKEWFEVQNNRKASIEENYKWSTEDM